MAQSFFDLDIGGLMITGLEKDESIKEVLQKLFDRFGESGFYLADYWDADLSAIGIKNSTDGASLIYISRTILKNYPEL